MEIGCPREACTGCMACANSCPQNAICAKEDEQGFSFPVIEDTLCVSCGKCQRVCPQLDHSAPVEPKRVYAALAKEDGLREKSSSGGVFSLLARDVLQKGGVVFGAVFDRNWHVCHSAARTEDELEALRTSKYVQSDIGMTFREAKVCLEQGQDVLFVGTPCQIDGLRRCLGKDYSRLLTADLVCHGVPSPGILAQWLDHECRKHGAIESLSFRTKAPGWKTFRARICFQNGDTVDCKQNEGYMAGFLQNLYLRESCYGCRYASDVRIGDITLGDFWRYQETEPECIEDDDRGISLVMINTAKGARAFERIRSKAAVASRTVEDALKGNPVLKAPAIRSPQYEAFWRDHAELAWDALMERYAPSMPEEKDPVHPADREYYAMPYVKRHRKHVLHCMKTAVLNRLKKR